MEDEEESKRYSLKAVIHEEKVVMAELLNREKRRSSTPKRAEKKEFFLRLNKEKMQKLRPRSGSPVSRKKFLEELEKAQCLFKPNLNENTDKLAEEMRMRRKIERVDELLYEDAKKRKERKKQLERNVR